MPTDCAAWWSSATARSARPTAVYWKKRARPATSEPATTAKLRETQMMTLLLAEGAEFDAFFTKQLNIWGKVVRDANLKVE